MSSRRKLLAAAAVVCSLVGVPGMVLAQDPAQTPPPPAPAPSDPNSTPSSTAQPDAAAPAPAPAPAESVQVPVPTPAPAEETVAAPGAGKARGGKQFGEEIVVTGSRIRRKDLTTPAPVAVLSKEQIQASGKVSLGDFLQSLPEQGAALNTNVNNGGSGASRINLRGLDGTSTSQRTLVLLNGRRMVATGTGAVTGNGVDINTIPIAVVERIEVLKDGASSVYGSDAIGGVVNIITKKTFDGLEANAYEGRSTHGDGNTVDLSVTAGVASDRGSFMFSGGFFDQQPVFAGDRSWSNTQLDYDWNGNVTKIGSSRVPNGRILSPNLTGLPPARSYTFDGTLPGCVKDAFGKPNTACFRPFNPAALPPNGDLYNFQPSNYDVTPNRRVSLFAAGDLKLSESVPVRAFFESALTHRESAYQLAPEPLIIGAGGVDVTVSKDNFYNPFGKDFAQVTRRLVEFGPRHQSQTADTFRVVGGLDGQLPFGWSWDAALIYGRTDWANINQGNVWQTRLQNAVGPSFLDPKTNTVTCGTAAAPIGGGCVPLNLFGGVGSISPTAAKYLGITTVSSVTNELTSVQLNTAGELPITLLADRPLGLAVGYEYRFEQGSDTPDAITAGGEDSNGTRVATGGNFHTNEVYAELSIPIANHLPGVENLEATASARVFDYSNFGTDYTYKAGGRYSPVSDITIRGTYSTAYRAPNVADLFTGNFDNFPTVSDPCSDLTNASPTLRAACAASGVPPAGSGQTDTQLRVTNGGNPRLKPETAKTFTVGVVLEPSMVKNLSFTVDYYHIDITKAISTQGAAFILGQCYPSSGTPNPAACAAIQRDSQNFITRITDLNTNVGGLKTAGVDIGARYTIPTEGFGRFGFGFDGNFLQFFDQIQADGTVIHGRGNFDIGQINGGIQGVYPTFKALGSVAWALGGLGAGGTVHYTGNIKQCAASDGTSTGGLCSNNPLHMERDVGAYAQIDAFLSYSFKSTAGTTSIAGGVNNLFDAAPRLIYGALEPNSDPTAYDFMGRFVYVRLTQRL
ncbi:MAG TPA: TonB-dependent receptor [Anaeromyxobacteraceae bacterium]|nr:TonB-dependent receptor [Anaeromyxobacteraceae bacterium]